VRLFQHSTRSMALTEEGAVYLECCRQVLGELEKTEAQLHATRSTVRGVLRVSLPIAGMLLLPAIVKFMDAYPDIQLDLDFSDRLVDVIEEGFDVVVRAGEAADTRLMSRKSVAQDELKALCGTSALAWFPRHTEGGMDHCG
jgi:DNA-binding transcriptional LysR family regulator